MCEKMSLACPKTSLVALPKRFHADEIEDLQRYDEKHLNIVEAVK